MKHKQDLIENDRIRAIQYLIPISFCGITFHRKDS